MLLKRLQLGLIHVAVAMTLVPINSTLNRVMIKELSLSATLVAALASLPYFLSPMQMGIGSFSDRYPIAGLRRTPYIAIGLLLCVGGVILVPNVAYQLATHTVRGYVLGLLAFGAWGLGFNFATVSYLSLASELSEEKGKSRTVAVMWFMMIIGIILTSVVLSHLVDPYTPERIQRAFRLIGLVALALGVIGLVKLENRSIAASRAEKRYPWKVLFQAVWDNPSARLFFWYLFVLLAAILGQDILLEPFAAEAFDWSVKTTTRITSLWGVCVLITLIIAGVLQRTLDKRTIARWGGAITLLGFIIIGGSGLLAQPQLFYLGVVWLGLGTGLSTVSNLSLMLDMTTKANVGLFIGAWGMANALSRLMGSILGGALRDVLTQVTHDPVLGFVIVFLVEAGLIGLSLIWLGRLNIIQFRRHAQSLVERSAVALES